MEPQVHRFTGGWAVSGGGLAAFASTMEEALRHYRAMASTSRQCEAGTCTDEASFELDGVALCATHYCNVRSRAGALDTADRSPISAPVRPPSSERRRV